MSADTPITMKMRATIGDVSAADAQRKLESDVRALELAAEMSPNDVFTRDTVDKATSMIAWHRAQAAKWDRFVRVV